MERVKGIEPSLSAWEADVLPLNYTRRLVEISLRTSRAYARLAGVRNHGAEDGIRTRDPRLGKAMLYP